MAEWQKLLHERSVRSVKQLIDRFGPEHFPEPDRLQEAEQDADRAAAIIRRGLAKNKSRIAFPWPTYFASWLTGALPPGLTDVFFRKLPEK